MPLFFRLFFIGLFTGSVAFAQIDTTKSDMSFDFGWTRNRNVNLWPIIKKSRSKDHTDIQALFTIFRYNHNIKAGTKHIHCLPVFIKDSNAQTSDLKLFSIYYPSLLRIQKNHEEQSRSFIVFDIAPKINFLELTKSKDGLFVQNNLFFFLWYKNNQITNRSHLVAFPLYWQYKNPNYKSITFAPLFSKGKSSDSLRSHLMATPLFWHVQTSYIRRTILFPLVWNSVTVYDERRKVFFPLYWSYKDKFDRSYLTIFPIYWNFKDKEKQSKVLFPLVWKFKKPKYHCFTFFPLFSKGSSADSSKSHLAISPIYWNIKNGDNHRRILFPLWWSGSSGTGLLKESHKLFFPLYWSNKNAYGNSSVLFPLIWKIKKPKESTFAFIPFFSIKKSSDSLTASNFSITPLFWHKKTRDGYRNILFPLWWNGSKGLGESKKYYNVIFPVYWSFKGKGNNSQVLFPLVWSIKTPKYRSFTLMPFFSYGHSADSSKRHIGVTPLFWHIHHKDEKRNILFPIWWNKTSGTGEDKDNYNVLFPFYWSYKNKYSNCKVLFPIAWNLKKIRYSDEKPYRTFAIFPFFSIGKSGDSSKRNRLSHFGISPFFWHFKNKDGYKNILFPIYWNKKSGSGKYVEYRNVLFPIYWARRTNDKQSQVLFPIWWSIKNDTGERARRRTVLFPILWTRKNQSVNNAVLFPFVWSYKNTEYKTLTVFPLFTYWQSADKQNKSLVTPFFWHIKNKENKTNVLFPLYWSIKNKQYNSITIFPFFSKGRSADKQKSHLVTPLFWHFKNKEKTTNILFPFGWSVKSDSGKNAQRRTTLFPFVWAKKDTSINNLIVLPCLYSLKNKNYRSFTLAPVFSKGRSEDGKFKHYAITPLFWHFKTPQGHKDVLFPIFTYASDSAHNLKFNLLYFLLRYKGNKQYKSISFIWPLCEYTKAPDQVSFRFAPVLWYKKSGSLRYFSIQPFYYHSVSKESEKVNILWELFSHKNYFNQKKSTSFLWKVVFRDKYYNNDHEFRILYLLYANMKKDGNVEKSLFPIYHYSTTKEGGRSFSLFLKFYSSLSRPIADSKEFYKETKVFWFLRIRSNYEYLKSKGVKNIKP